MQRFDRHRQDVGNIVFLEHVNVRVPDQRLATAFYIQGLGFTRDPYIMVGVENMWINMGQTQFHLPTGEPNVMRGHVEIVVPDLEAMPARLDAVRDHLKDTKFGYSVEDKYIAVTTPWGNRLRLFAAGPTFGDMTLGITHVEIPVETGRAAGIARFYEKVLGAPSTVTPDADGVAAHVKVSQRQEMVFRETSKPIPAYDGYHVAVYITNFSGPHEWLDKHGLVSEESNEYQYRFNKIVDPDTREELCMIEHEVRCYTHPMFFRPLVNRNPAQRQATYQRGRDAFYPAG
jgi:catechol 2,3-dioxygenase-like lactoylglutathione lyase family enzyme